MGEQCQGASRSPKRSGQGRSTIADVARMAGVSLGTVSNVLNKPEVVAVATRERVLRVIESAGFVRSTAAHQLRVGRSRTVGAVLLDLANPFFAEIAKGAEAVLSEHGYMLMVCSSEESADRERRYLRALEEHRVDGVLIAPVGPELRSVATLAARGVPTVLLDRDPGQSDLCSVTVDDVRGAELATRHLVDLGHRVIAFVNGPLSVRQCADRRKGARRALGGARRGLGVLSEIPVAALTVEHGKKAVSALLSASPRPTAVMCANDLLALGVLEGLSAAEVCVPAEMSVVGYDDVAYASMLSPSLTSVRQPKYELGVAAADLFLEEVGSPGHHDHRSVRFEPDLVVRASSGTPAGVL